MEWRIKQGGMVVSTIGCLQLKVNDQANAEINPVFTAKGKENVSFVRHIQQLRLTRTTNTQKTENNYG